MPAAGDQAPAADAVADPIAAPKAGADTTASDAKPGTSHAHEIHEPALATNLSAPASEARPAAPVAAAAGHDAAALDLNPASGVPAQPVATGPVATSVAATPNAPYAAAAYAPVPLSGLAVEIVAHARDGKNRFEIRLDPPELGRIDVHLHVKSDGTVTSRLVVERAETLDLLRRDAPSLERALQTAGLKTGEHGLEFSLRHHGADREQDGTARGVSRLVIPDDVQPLAATGSHYGRRLGLGAGLDIRV
jgi:chemotaxis protein MotD